MASTDDPPRVRDPRPPCGPLAFALGKAGREQFVHNRRETTSVAPARQPDQRMRRLRCSLHVRDLKKAGESDERIAAVVASA